MKSFENINFYNKINLQNKNRHQNLRWSIKAILKYVFALFDYVVTNLLSILHVD